MQWCNQAQSDIRLEWGPAAVGYVAQDVDCIVIVDVCRQHRSKGSQP
jgi:2-phosphosulfolactate phosphatase